MDKEEYSVKEFRDNLRIALDRADDGNDVFVKRHDKRYYLCVEEYYKELLKPDSESVELKLPPIAKKVIKTPTEALETVKKIFPQATQQHWCKNGHAIPDGYTKCLGKGCKYS